MIVSHALFSFDSETNCFISELSSIPDFDINDFSIQGNSKAVKFELRKKVYINEEFAYYLFVNKSTDNIEYAKYTVKLFND